MATDNLLDFEDNAKVMAESNGNSEEDQLDNRPHETNNNPSWVRASSSPLSLGVFQIAYFYIYTSTERQQPLHMGDMRGNCRLYCPTFFSTKYAVRLSTSRK